MNFIREPEQETLKYLLNMSVTLGCRSTNLTTCWWHWTTTSRLTATTFKSFSGILQILEQKAKDRILHNGRKTYTHGNHSSNLSLFVLSLFCAFPVCVVKCWVSVFLPLFMPTRHMLQHAASVALLFYWANTCHAKFFLSFSEVTGSSQSRLEVRADVRLKSKTLLRWLVWKWLLVPTPPGVPVSLTWSWH